VKVVLPEIGETKTISPESSIPSTAGELSVPPPTPAGAAAPGAMAAVG
jgi:hypothetical protein